MHEQLQRLNDAVDNTLGLPTGDDKRLKKKLALKRMSNMNFVSKPYNFYFQVGDPSKTAWMINEKGNKVWFRFEHTPSLFPVKETRFYKPKLHKSDFLGKNKDEEREI